MGYNNIRERFFRCISLPVETSENIPVVEIKCDSEANFYGFDKIKGYTENEIILANKTYSVYVKGEKIDLTEYCSGGMKVYGNITELRIEKI